MKAEFNKLLKTLNKNHSKYEGSKGAIEAFLINHIDFDFSIENLAGDGFCILDYDNSRLAPLEDCFGIIKKEGKLTQDNIKSISI